MARTAIAHTVIQVILSIPLQTSEGIHPGFEVHCRRHRSPKRGTNGPTKRTDTHQEYCLKKKRKLNNENLNKIGR